MPSPDKDSAIDCTVEQMRIAAEGHLTTEALMWNTNRNERTISGMTSEDFRLRLNDVLRKNYDINNQRYPEGYQEAPLAYDAVWSVALGEFYVAHITYKVENQHTYIDMCKTTTQKNVSHTFLIENTHI